MGELYMDNKKRKRPNGTSNQNNQNNKSKNNKKNNNKPTNNKNEMNEKLKQVLLEKLIENENNLQTLYLNNNNLENYVTQNVNGQVILIDNIEILKKMNKAGLKELNISGNSFQDTSELKKLQWNSYND